MHWYKDCPQKSSKSNNADPSHGSPNCISVINSKWPHYTPNKSDNRLVKASSDQATANSAVVEHCLPGQDFTGYEDLFSSICNNSLIVHSQAQIAPDLGPDTGKFEAKVALITDYDHHGYASSLLMTCPSEFSDKKDNNPYSTLDTLWAYDADEFALIVSRSDGDVEDMKDSICNDFRQVNEISEADHIPVPGFPPWL
ncbi:hypothetical protein QFC21_006948 [Naganishia friedmannii]|uniref:Uncharacterized protein n=1 Tax=Naganishia friedmannii TaxID=89922 RepID=A0ACC2UZM1_9TREE|nr:hypothetical protein QFC21_006948 [Naganishia friedmannii]